MDLKSHTVTAVLSHHSVSVAVCMLVDGGTDVLDACMGLVQRGYSLVEALARDLDQLLDLR